MHDVTIDNRKELANKIYQRKRLEEYECLLFADATEEQVLTRIEEQVALGRNKMDRYKQTVEKINAHDIDHKHCKSKRDIKNIA